MTRWGSIAVLREGDLRGIEAERDKLRMKVDRLETLLADGVFRISNEDTLIWQGWQEWCDEVRTAMQFASELD